MLHHPPPLADLIIGPAISFDAAPTVDPNLILLAVALLYCGCVFAYFYVTRRDDTMRGEHRRLFGKQDVERDLPRGNRDLW
jgi:hypothetical protein